MCERLFFNTRSDFLDIAGCSDVGKLDAGRKAKKRLSDIWNCVYAVYVLFPAGVGDYAGSVTSSASRWIMECDFSE